MTETGKADPSGAGQRRLCYVVDDEPAICRMVSLALRNFGVDVEHFHDVESMTAGLKARLPDFMLLDVTLGSSDAVEAIRSIAAQKMTGPVYLMSGRDAALLEDVRRVGERHGLKMGAVLTKPFRVDALKRIVDASLKDGAAPQNDPHPSGPTGGGTQARVNLGEALDRGWLELWYQPKLDLAGEGRVTGAEGLARVRHPEHGVMFPGSFVPGASAVELSRLAEYALHVALRDTVEFAQAGVPLKLAVNFPAAALESLPIGAIVRDARRGQDSSWGGIVLEVTEDQIINDIDMAHEIATQLRIHRVDLAIDDFGSGYSSLARLKELPFAELKLDRSFVDKCGDDETNAALCRTVVDLAHRFGCVAVAEGIEREVDLAHIRAIGCDIAQGFLFAKAMPKEMLMKRLQESGAEFSAAIAADEQSSATLAV